MEKMIIKNVRTLDPFNHVDSIGDIFIQDGLITNQKAGAAFSSPLVINAAGLIAAPGLIDLHVHLRDPGLTYKEDIRTGCLAAAAGGFTSIAAMPNTSPIADSPEIIEYVLGKSRNAAARVYPLASITKGLNGEILNDFQLLKSAGAVAFSDDGRPVLNSAIMYEAMKMAKNYNMRIFAHCEDLTFAGDGIMNRGTVSKLLNLEGISPSAEDAGTARELLLSYITGCPVHICHVSTRTSVELIRGAKAAGVLVTAETAPHYFALSEEKLLTRDANYRMNPPLRSISDMQAVIEGLMDGTIDAIATDHAPHSPQEKSNFLKSPNGVVGLETSLAAGIRFLVHEGYITLQKLMALMSLNPAGILGINAGKIHEGMPADIVLFDEEEKWTVDPSKFYSKARNSAFKGMELIGKVKYTICAGKLVYSSKHIENGAEKFGI